MNALEEILEEVKAVGNIQFSSYTDLLIPVKDVEKIIRSHMNDVPDINVGEWIPVSERLPEEYYLPTPPEVDNDYMANQKQKERVKRLIQQGHHLTRKKVKYDECQLSIF